MLYLVRIGRETDKGKFKETQSFGVSTAGTKSGYSEVLEHYRNKYVGLAVCVERPYIFELRNENPECRETSYLTEVAVDYSDEERPLADRLARHEEEADKIRGDLRRMITERFRMLGYTYVGSKPLDIRLCDDGAVIEKLPIKGTAFLRHVGTGMDLEEEAEHADSGD